MFRNKDSQQVGEVVYGIWEVDDRAAIELFPVRRTGRGEHVGKYGGLCSEKAPVYAKRDVLSNQNDVAVFQPKLKAAT